MRAPRLRVRADVIAVAAVGALLRLAVFLAAVRSPERFWSQDDRDYLGVARNLHAAYLADAGHWFEVGLRRPPVYPLFMRLVFEAFGSHYAAVVAAQIGVGVATVALTYWFASLQLPRGAALAAASLVALDPASVVFSNQMLTETLFTFFLVVALALTLVGARSGSMAPLAIAGIALGIATLTRPVAEYLPLVLVATLIVIARARMRRALALSCALAAGYALPVGAWVIHNDIRTGVPVVSTIDGHNMLDYRAVGALVEDGEKPWEARAYVGERLAARLDGGENPAEVSRVQMRLGIEILAEHPVGAVESWAKGEARLLGGPAKTETATLLTGRARVTGAPLLGLVALSQLVTILLVVAGGAGIVGLLVRRLEPRALWISAVTVLYLVVISGGPEAYSRFRVPVTPCLAVLGVAAVAFRRRERGSTPTPPGPRPAR